MLSPEEWSDLPGADLVRQGFDDLATGEVTAASLLVSIGAPKLRTVLGELPHPTLPNPEHRLYQLLAAEDRGSAHSRYNAYIRRLVSFERAAECVR